MKTIRVRSEYFSHISSGKKDREVRASHPLFEAVSVGETVRFACGDEGVSARVVSVRRYRCLFLLVLREQAGSILPGRSKSDVFRALRSIYPREKRNRGFIVIAFEVVPQESPPESNPAPPHTPGTS